jgi:lipopolysaccharide assembly outer membrane protein LptD (OstA)
VSAPAGGPTADTRAGEAEGTTAGPSGAADEATEDEEAAGAAEEAGPAPVEEQEKLAPGEIRVRAEVQRSEQGHYHAEGNVDLRFADLRIQADALDIYDVERPDGTKGRKAVAVGNVVFIREEERLAGDRLDMDLDAGTGTFENARGYMNPGVLFEGKVVERLDASTYRIEGGRFTACTQPDPRWGFTSSSAKVKVDDKVIAKNVLFRIRGVPAFYLPFLVYPIRQSQRSTGILLPHFGNSSLRGVNIGTGFFWAMGRSADQTFYADTYLDSGYGLGHELRWALDRPSQGRFKTYAFNPKEGDEWEYDLDWTAVQMLPGAAKAGLQVRRFSNFSFQNRYQDSFVRATSRTSRATLSVQKAFPFGNAQLLADDNRTYFSDQTRVNRRLPSVRLSRPARKIGRTPIALSYDLRGEELGRGNQDGVDEYSRFDVAPQLSVPFSTTFLRVNPQVSFRYTHYGSSRTDEGIVGPPLDRRYFETAVSVVGPTFSRVFNTPGGAYTDKFKHVIGPEITWRYRTPVDDFDLIPKFDGLDQQLGTHQVDYALVQRLYARRPDDAGRVSAWEFLSWALYQTYYVQIGDGQNEFDPNYSSSFFGPGGVPDHNSPIASRLKVRPTRGISGTFSAEYDVNFKQIRNLSLGGGAEGPRASFAANWNRARRVSEDPEERTETRNFLRGAARVRILGERLTLEGSVNYDYLQRTLLQSAGRATWQVQCCGFTVETIQYNWNGRDERQFRFSVQLANLGSIGNNFMGDALGPAAAGGRFQ